MIGSQRVPPLQGLEPLAVADTVATEAALGLDGRDRPGRRDTAPYEEEVNGNAAIDLMWIDRSTVHAVCRPSRVQACWARDTRDVPSISCWVR